MANYVYTEEQGQIETFLVLEDGQWSVVKKYPNGSREFSHICSNFEKAYLAYCTDGGKLSRKQINMMQKKWVNEIYK